MVLIPQYGYFNPNHKIVFLVYYDPVSNSKQWQWMRILDSDIVITVEAFFHFTGTYLTVNSWECCSAVMNSSHIFLLTTEADGSTFTIGGLESVISILLESITLVSEHVCRHGLSTILLSGKKPPRFCMWQNYLDRKSVV